MNRYECPYVSDGVKYSAAIWADSEAEAVEKMRLLPWQPGNGPLPRHRRQNQGALVYVLLLLLAIAATATTALTFRRATIELKQAAQLMHLDHIAYPPGPGRTHHQV